MGKKLNILLGCEESQRVCIAMRKRGHKAFSCDTQPCSGNKPQYHLQMDVFEAIKLRRWDRIIFFPPCTKVCLSGNRHYGKGKRKFKERLQAVKWTQKLWNFAIKNCNCVAMENPHGTLNTYGIFPKPQYIQPYQLGHGEQKKTGLWLHNLPPLKPTKIVRGRKQNIWMKFGGGHKDHGKLRSKTYPGIAMAMAKQWA